MYSCLWNSRKFSDNSTILVSPCVISNIDDIFRHLVETNRYDQVYCSIVVDINDFHILVVPYTSLIFYIKYLLTL